LAEKRMTSPPDQHIHTALCGHARGSMEEMVQAAIDRGMPYIGFTAHLPYPPSFVEPVPDCVIPSGRFQEYMNEGELLRRKYSDRIEIGIGAEVDFLPEYLDETRLLLKQHRFDMIIGSIHILDGVPVDYSEDVLKQGIRQFGSIREMWRRYLACMDDMILAGFCDVVGHLDLPKKFSGEPDWEWIGEAVDRVLGHMKDRDMALDINTGGIDRSVTRTAYPSRRILELAAEAGIAVILGSDAHEPGQVGRYFDRMTPLLKSLGWDSIRIYKSRGKRTHAL